MIPCLDLANILLASKGVKVTAALSNFGDRFFDAIVQFARGQFVDLREPVTGLSRALDALAPP